MLTSESIRKLEMLEFNVQDKVNILLVASGLKPASHIECYGDNTFSGISSHIQDNLDGILSVLDDIGLPHTEPAYSVRPHIRYDEEEKKPKCTGFEEVYLIKFASTRENLDRLNKARDDEEEGYALGFPPINVEYFVGKKMVKEGSKAARLTDEEKEKLSFLSYITELRDPEAVKQSLELARTYSMAVKKLSPSIYNKNVKFAVFLHDLLYSKYSGPDGI